MANQMDPHSPFPSSAGLPEPPVLAQLEKILQSRTFTKAPSLSRLLRHLVQQAIQGNPSPSKEYSIGVEVFERGDLFDPRIDTIVRVQARRLRAKLAEYYAAEGHADPIVIEVPKGQYVATVRPASQQLPAASPTPAQPPSSIPLEQFGPVSATSSLPLAKRRTPLVGRQTELALVERMLQGDSGRLVTLWGAGGVGKTRLAVEAATQLAPHFPGGVWFVSLASISDPGMVASALAHTLGLRQVADKPLATALQDHVQLAIKAPALLVIDNAEHVLEAAPLFGLLLDASGDLHMLVTSRSILHLYGEQAVSLAPLPTPDIHRLPDLQELSRNPSIQLFVQRATAVNSAFHLTPANCRAVAEICVRVDGLPLAIELAAARLRMLSPDEILIRLQHPLELLTGGSRDLDVRQQTLRNAVEWSYALLDPLEQKLFRRLAVFAGGCTLESAEAVCDAKRDLGLNVLQGISSLVDKSLLYQREQSDKESRFAMFQSIRDYALDRLIATGEESGMRRAHAAYVLVIAEERNLLDAPAGIAAWTRLCDAEQDNIRAALDWLIATGNGEWALRLGLALFHFWEIREHLAEGRKRLQSILDMESTAGATSSRARVAFCAGTFMASQCDYQAALIQFQQALHLYRQLGDEKGVAAMLTAMGTAARLSGDLKGGRMWLLEALQSYRDLNDRSGIAGALSNLADVANVQGDYSMARTLLNQAAQMFNELDDSAGCAWSYSRLGDVAYLQKEWVEAGRLYGQGLNIFRTLGDRWGMARSYTDLGHVACEQGDYERAQSLFVQALETLRVLGHTRGMARVFEGFAWVAAHDGSFARALKLAGVAAGLRHTLGASTRPEEDAFLHSRLKPAWKNLDVAQANKEWTGGTAMPLDQAIRFALDRALP